MDKCYTCDEIADSATGHDARGPSSSLSYFSNSHYCATTNTDKCEDLGASCNDCTNIANGGYCTDIQCPDGFIAYNNSAQNQVCHQCLHGEHLKEVLTVRGLSDDQAEADLNSIAEDNKNTAVNGDLESVGIP